MKENEVKTDAGNSQTGNLEPNKKTGKFDKLKFWFKKLGFVGFLFFFIKGILWLIIPYLVAVGLFDWFELPCN